MNVKFVRIGNEQLQCRADYAVFCRGKLFAELLLLCAGRGL